MKLSLARIPFFAFSFWISACAFVPDAPSEPTPVAETQVGGAGSDVEKPVLSSGGATLEARVEANPDPHDYDVQLSWAYPMSQNHKLVRIAEHKSETRFLGTYDGTASSFRDGEVEPGGSYTYVLEALDSAQPRQLWAKARIPRDHVINEAAEVATIPVGIRRLFLGPQARIYRNDPFTPTKLEVHELIAQRGATIQPLAPGLEAESGRSAPDPARFEIRAHRARGELFLSSHGIRGGAGGEGPAGVMGRPGARGSNAVSRWETQPSPLCRSFGPALPVLDPRARGPVNDCRPFVTEVCAKPAGNGGPGEAGGTGGAGRPGFAGSRNVPITVQIADAHGFHVDYDAIAGEGGRGGSGGPGGRGGRGGPPGSKNKVCHQGASFGPEGPQGERGPPGPSGPAGERVPPCLELGPVLTAKCSS